MPRTLIETRPATTVTTPSLAEPLADLKLDDPGVTLARLAIWAAQSEDGDVGAARLALENAITAANPDAAPRTVTFASRLLPVTRWRGDHPMPFATSHGGDPTAEGIAWAIQHGCQEIALLRMPAAMAANPDVAKRGEWRVQIPSREKTWPWVCFQTLEALIAWMDTYGITLGRAGLPSSGHLAHITLPKSVDDMKPLVWR
jgi:hypothetical protein